VKAGWERRRLFDFSELVSTGPFGSVLHKSDYVSRGVPLVNPVNIIGDQIVPNAQKLIDEKTRLRLSSYILKVGDIVVGRRGEIGRCAVVSDIEDGWVCGTGCFFIRPLPSMSAKFLANLIRSDEYRERLESASSGATMKNLSNSALGELVISAPPLAEQQRIVAILDEAFDGIATAKANAEKNLQNARALFESHLSSVFARAENEVCLSQVATDVSDGDHSAPPKSPSGVPFITISNINKRTRQVDFTDTFMVPEAYFAKLKTNRKPMCGDVLYTVTGSFGIPVLVDHDKHFCFQRHIGLVRPNSQTDSVWLNFALQSPQSFAQANSGATGTAQKTVSLSVLRNMKVPSISLKAQRVIAAELSELESQTQHLESLYQQKLAALDELKKSLLHQAFSGEL
jgi:type I restriction enzyme, S subunit